MVCCNRIILDIKEYISSGIIESYVLGVVSDQERQEVECLSHIYPEIREQLLLAQDQLEKLSEGWKKTPPEMLKKRVITAIQKEEKPDTKVIQLPQNNAQSSSFSKWVAAASILLVAGASILFFLKRSELSEAESNLAAKNREIKQKATLVAQLEKQIQTYNDEQVFMTDDQTVAIAMAGTPNSPKAKVKAYWNKGKNQVLLAGMNLPKQNPKQQYQLWAIVDGKPVDLGMLNMDNPNQPISKKVVDTDVQAFAITLEKKGGSPTPNLDQLMVMGNVGS